MERYWMKVEVSCGPMNSDGTPGPMMAEAPNRWIGLSYDQLVAMQEILHKGQGELVALSKEHAKTKKG